MAASVKSHDGERSVRGRDEIAARRRTEWTQGNPHVSGFALLRRSI